MVFKIVKKTLGKNSLESDEVRITEFSASFGVKVHEFIGENKRLEIYFDREKNKVGFNPTNDIITGFKLVNKSNSGRGGTLNGIKCLKNIPTGVYKSVFEDGMFIIQVEKII